MKIVLKEGSKKHGYLILLTCLFALSAVALEALPGFAFILFPLCAGVCSSLLIFDFTKAKIYGIVSLVICASSAIVEYLLWGEPFIFLTVCFSFIIGAVNRVCFGKDLPKSVAAAINTALTVILLFLSLWFVSYYQTGSWEFSAFSDYYVGVVKSFENDTIGYFEASFNSQIGVSKEDVAESLELLRLLFKQIYFNALGIACALSFIAVGISYKVLSAFSDAFSENPEEMRSHGFKLSSVFGYFYLVIFVLNAFISFDSPRDVYSIAVSSLYLVYTVVFAYLGLKVVFEFLKARFHRTLMPALIIAFALFAFSSLAIDLLAVIGCIGAITQGKKKPFDFSDGAE